MVVSRNYLIKLREAQGKAQDALEALSPEDLKTALSALSAFYEAQQAMSRNKELETELKMAYARISATNTSIGALLEQNRALQSQLQDAAIYNLRAQTAARHTGARDGDIGVCEDTEDAPPWGGSSAGEMPAISPLPAPQPSSPAPAQAPPVAAGEENNTSAKFDAKRAIPIPEEDAFEESRDSFLEALLRERRESNKSSDLPSSTLEIQGSAGLNRAGAQRRRRHRGYL